MRDWLILFVLAVGLVFYTVPLRVLIGWTFVASMIVAPLCALAGVPAAYWLPPWLFIGCVAWIASKHYAPHTKGASDA